MIRAGGQDGDRLKGIFSRTYPGLFLHGKPSYGKGMGIKNEVYCSGG